MRKIKLGRHNIGNVFLAPMAGVSDPAFRTLCLRHGFGLAVNEMVSANALARLHDDMDDAKAGDRDDKKSEALKTSIDSLLVKTKEEEIFAQQVFGEDHKAIAKAVEVLQDEYHADIIDINFGCPVRKITDQGAGSDLLKHPEKIRKIVESAVSVAKVPITCKIRLGINDRHINATETSRIIENAGARLITVHGRTQAQGYSGECDYQEITKVKENANIPIIANGNIASREDIENVERITSCDGVMIGRAAKNNPCLLEDKKAENLFDEYFQIMDKYELDVKFPLVKEHAMSFTKGMELGPKIRERLIGTKTIDEIRRLLDDV